MPEPDRRRKMIREVIASNAVGTQAELVRRLRKAGIACTQASVSRDIRDLGLVKLGGRYSLPTQTAGARGLDSEALQRIRSVQAAGEVLLVVRSNPGEASLVAIAIDNERWPSVAGTIAGDDTVFVACPDRSAQTKTLRRLNAALAGAQAR